MTTKDATLDTDTPTRSVTAPQPLTDPTAITAPERLARLRLVAFDLDDTLAPSKCRLEDAMVAAVTALLGRWDVCIISGGSVAQFEHQVIAAGAPDWDRARLHLMPTCGTQYLRWTDRTHRTDQTDQTDRADPTDRTGAWSTVYAELLTDDEKRLAMEALEQCARQLGCWEGSPWGARIEDRGTQITFSALGQQAPVAAKRGWDPDGAKRRRLHALVQQRLEHLEVRVGGSTSLDITRRGIDKSYGMRKLLAALDVEVDEVLFVGDRLEVGGNDFAVRSLGIPCTAVEQWQETLGIIDRLVAAHDARSVTSSPPGSVSRPSSVGPTTC